MATSRRGLREDGGFTIIEVLVAALILTLASAALFGVLAAGARNGARAKATQVALDRAQQEMEKLHSLSYEELALTTRPQPSPNPLNPNYRVVNNNFALKREPQEELAPMVVNNGPLTWGRKIYRTRGRQTGADRLRRRGSEGAPLPLHRLARRPHLP